MRDKSTRDKSGNPLESRYLALPGARQEYAPSATRVRTPVVHNPRLEARDSARVEGAVSPSRVDSIVFTPTRWTGMPLAIRSEDVRPGNAPARCAPRLPSRRHPGVS